MGHRIDDAAGCPITLIQGVDTLLGTAPPPPAHLCSGDSTNVDEDPEVPAADSSDVRAAQPF